MTTQEFIEKVNFLAVNETPFFFVIDFDKHKPFVCSLDVTLQEKILYDIKGQHNYKRLDNGGSIEVFKRKPVSPDKYNKAFLEVKRHINRGDSYLVNLTFPTELDTNQSLKDLFFASRAPYKLLYKDEFLVFSPECFVRITDNRIYSYPMKGTIDASIEGAAEKLLASKKELYEHNTIVDLIRNDLSIVSKDVTVSKFRFIDKIKTNQKDLLQVSSEITGTLEVSWRHNLGRIIMNLLPAGSISGAPKQRTVEIISAVEQKERGYFTGIFGIYAGKELDSAVNIRYIEKNSDGLYFRSGGGITALSEAETEYEEMVNKVYVPVG